MPEKMPPSPAEQSSLDNPTVPSQEIELEPEILTALDEITVLRSKISSLRVVLAITEHYIEDINADRSGKPSKNWEDWYIRDLKEYRSLLEEDAIRIRNNIEQLELQIDIIKQPHRNSIEQEISKLNKKITPHEGHILTYQRSIEDLTNESEELHEPEINRYRWKITTKEEKLKELKTNKGVLEQKLAIIVGA